MLTMNKPFWSKDQNDLLKVIIWNDFFRNEFGRNLDMVPYLSFSHLSFLLETFQSFPELEELQLQVNNISCIHISHKDFPSLRKLDLSYNPIKEKALLNLGKLRHLESLDLQGCELVKLPPELARGYLVSQG